MKSVRILVALLVLFLVGPSARAGVMGVSIQDLTPELAEALGIPAEGVIVRQLSPGGPAEQAGLRVGDVVVEINRKPVRGKADFVAKAKDTPGGKSLALTVWREGEGRYFIGVRLASDGQVASPQDDRQPRSTSDAPVPATAIPSSDQPPVSTQPQPEVVPIQPTPIPPQPTPIAAQPTPLPAQPTAAPAQPATASPDKPPTADASGNVVQNGGFEQGLSTSWGSGSINEGRPWRVLEGTRAFGDAVAKPVHSGNFALSIRHLSDEHSGWMGVTSQALGALPQGQQFRLSVWAKGENLMEGAIRLRIVRQGQRPGVAKGLTGGDLYPELPIAELVLPGGAFEFRLFETTFTAPGGNLDLEVLSVAKGLAYVDDISVTPAR